MLDTGQNFIPVLTSEAGLCLTAANWQEVNVDVASYYLDSLLLKPGATLLKQLPDLAAYLGWSGTLVLNASRLSANKEGIFVLVSPFDGSKLKLSAAELIELILHLKPDAVLLPKKTMQHVPELWEQWTDSITPFIAANDLLNKELQRPHGVYFNIDKDEPRSDVVNKVSKWNHLPRYVTGDLNLDLIAMLRTQGVEFVESEEPAKAALQGQVFNAEAVVDITDSTTAMQFELIDDACICPTCAQKLTKAYLHHLYLHTPLLAQRFLIQHNVFHALS